jgi:hypothetical protein
LNRLELATNRFFGGLFCISSNTAPAAVMVALIFPISVPSGRQIDTTSLSPFMVSLMSFLFAPMFPISLIMNSMAFLSSGRKNISNLANKNDFLLTLSYFVPRTVIKTNQNIVYL